MDKIDPVGCVVEKAFKETPNTDSNCNETIKKNHPVSPVKSRAWDMVIKILLLFEASTFREFLICQ